MERPAFATADFVRKEFLECNFAGMHPYPYRRPVAAVAANP
jgi:hypothetical protein